MNVKTTRSQTILRKRFGMWLREKREERGLTQVDLAYTLGYAYSTTVSHVERGAVGMPPIELLPWADAIGVTPKKMAEQYLYFVEPLIYAALFGKDPYVAEKLPRPNPNIKRIPNALRKAAKGVPAKLAD